MASVEQVILGGGSLSEKPSEYQYVPNKTWVKWVNAEGVASRTLTRQLARNALVRKYTVRVGATRADATTLANSGQVRLQAESGGSKIVVVDFGMLRTVSGVGRPPKSTVAMTICSLRAFRGDAFDTKDLYFEDCDTEDPDAMMIKTVEENTFEVRTERVRLKIKTTADLPTIAANVWLQFPDLPSDLEIRINGGAPAWTAPGVAQGELRGWDENAEQVADLTSGLATLTGNAKDSSPLEASIVLTSRIPGVLTLEEAAVDIAYVGRISFDGNEDKTLVLDQEGQYDIVLTLPSWVKKVQEVRATLTGTVPTERTLQPVGPPVAQLSTGTGAAYDLLLDIDHPGAARLDAAKPFAELVAVRLPLRAGPDGAEVRAVVYEGNDDDLTQPASGGTSKPVDLSPAVPGAGDVWTTFTLPKPIKLDPKRTYWVLVVVGRGAASWSLGTFESVPDTVPVRRGGASGPWHLLPNVLQGGAGGATIGGRVRAVGKAPPSAPVAPLTVTVVGHEQASVNATPTPKGVNVTWIAPGVVSGTTHPDITPGGTANAPTITLRITSRMTGTVKLSAVDVVATK